MIAVLRLSSKYVLKLRNNYMINVLFCTNYYELNKIKIPEPTWSIEYLQVKPNVNKPYKLTDEDFSEVAKRTLVDIRYLSSDRLNLLREGLDEILNRISLLKTMNWDKVTGRRFRDDGELNDDRIYDIPRRLSLKNSYSIKTMTKKEEQWNWRKSGGEEDIAKIFIKKLKNSRNLVIFKEESFSIEDRWYFPAP